MISVRSSQVKFFANLLLAKGFSLFFKKAGFFFQEKGGSSALRAEGFDQKEKSRGYPRKTSARDWPNSFAAYSASETVFTSVPISSRIDPGVAFMLYRLSEKFKGRARPG